MPYIPHSVNICLSPVQPRLKVVVHRIQHLSFQCVQYKATLLNDTGLGQSLPLQLGAFSAAKEIQSIHCRAAVATQAPKQKQMV